MTTRVESLNILGMNTQAILDNIIVINTENNGDNVSLMGLCEAKLIRKDGSGIYQIKRNLIVNSGFDFLCDVTGKSSQPTEMSHIAIGSGTTAAGVTQTALVSELARGSATYSHTTGTKIFKLSYTFPAGTGTGTVTEAACLNAASNGTMLNRSVFNGIVKGASDSLEIIFTFTLS